MVSSLPVFFTFSLHLTLHDDDVLPLATFWPMEAIKPSFQAPPLHWTMVLIPWVVYYLAADSRGRQHRQRPQHVNR